MLLHTATIAYSHHRRRLHGGDRPHRQKVVGAMLSSRPTEILLSFLETVKFQQNYECVIMLVTKVVQISA